MTPKMTSMMTPTKGIVYSSTLAVTVLLLLTSLLHIAAGSDVNIFDQDDENLISDSVRTLMELEGVSFASKNSHEEEEDDEIGDLKEFNINSFSESDVDSNDNSYSEWGERTNYHSNGFMAPVHNSVASPSRNSNKSLRQTSSSLDLDLDASRHFLHEQDEQDREMLEEELFIPVSRTDNSLVLSRSRRALEAGSGEVVVQTQLIIVGTPTAQQLIPGSAENIALRLDIAEAVRIYLNAYYPGLTFLTETTLIVGGSIIATVEVLYDTDVTTIVQLAQAYFDMASIKNGATYVILEQDIAPSTGEDLRPAVCYLCVSPQECVNQVLDDGTLDWFCQTLSTFYFPFGPSQGDFTLSRDVEDTTIRINIETGFPYLSEILFDFYISVNGIISFGEPFTDFKPTRLPTAANNKLLAVYWSDLDLLTADPDANVYYQLYTKTPFNTASETAIFTKANNDVRTQIGIQYDAIYVTVVTWDGLPPWIGTQNLAERVYFQASIITDGQSTFVSYVYPQGGLNFNPILQRPLEIGWGSVNFGTTSSYYNFDQVVGNTNLPGYWFFQIGQESNSRALCRNWFQSNLPVIRFIAVMNSIVPRCPCNERAAAFNFFWLTSFEQAGCYDMFPLLGQYGRRCCYRQDGSLAFENRIPVAGSFQWSTPYSGNPALHQVQDIQPKRWCCEESDLCSFYYGVRPISTCISNRRFRRSFAWGDPHIKTLDGTDYIFNGLGEYTLLDISGTYESPTEVNGTETTTTTPIDFELQGRTCQSVTANGTLTSATQWCALAARNTNGETIRISLDSGTNSYMEIYIDGEDFSARFAESANFSTFKGNMALRKVNNSINVYTTDNVGVTVGIIDTVFVLSFEISENLKGIPQGLFGNFNDDPIDDLIYRDGTVLPPNAPDSDIFAMGQSWAITQETSLFAYEFGKNTSTYSDPNFTPIFLDNVANETKANAAAVCGGDTNQACIFDYIATANSDLALQSGIVIDLFDEQETQLDNQAPNITQASVNATVGEPTNFVINAADPDNDAITYVILASPGSGEFTYTNQSGVLTGVFTPSNLDPVSINIVAQDSNGQQSEISILTIKNCGNCSNHGSCDYDTSVSTSGSYYSVSPCVCETPYSGDNCQFDRNGCALSPCPVGTNCTDLPVDEEIALGRGYNCTACPAGYELSVNDSKCVDVDECTSASSNCDFYADCTNIIGSHICTCKIGFRKSVLEDICADIDECIENSHKCAQQCNNTIGSFECECFPGFQKSADGRNCTKVEGLDPCLTIPNNCSYGCRNTSGVAECYCEHGYKVASDGFNCEDIHECELSTQLCSQECTDSDGSYSCSCFPGFILNVDEHDCDPCSPGTYGMRCESQCECRGRATACDPVQGCLCNDQWTGTSCEVDIDECLTENICPPDKFCVNTNGSYSCNCPVGFEDANNDGNCTDIDECVDPSIHQCPQQCRNNPGSFRCICSIGYNYDLTNNTCVDINECELNIDECQQKCENTLGSFNCMCQPGYVLNADRKTCILETDLCANKTIACDQICTFEDGQPACKCRIGFFLGTDLATCFDINECDSNTTNSCSDFCDNNNGSYSCSCPDGKELQNDLRTCRDCDEYHWGPNCANECDCNALGMLTCDPVKGCQCKTGRTGVKCEIDENECEVNENPCPDNSDCMDISFSYVCQCRTGYQLNATNQCEDINECDSNPCDQTCTNSQGSYLCTCFQGFIPEGDKCKDIDECERFDSHRCEQICRNTQGFYACECYAGFRLNTTDGDRRSCTAEETRTTCLTNNTCDTGCRLDGNGNELCYCNSGFELDATNSSLCVDINECKPPNNPCTLGTCSNNDGGFTCTCDVGFRLAADKTTCLACEEGTYGAGCSQSCECDAFNTLSCNSTNGECLCIDGYNGNNCSADINECNQTVTCGPFSSCKNRPGSYVCGCDEGYVHSNGDCVTCSSNTYGLDCSNQCNCKVSNTFDCDNVNGTCHCRPEWQGVNCTDDVDECLDTSMCPGRNETCENSIGSYACGCDIGYTRISDVCVDINECLTINDVCTSNQTCINTDGSYTCVCADGFRGVGDQCVDVNECDSGAANCSINEYCNNLVPGFECLCLQGYARVNDVCQDIDECSDNSLNDCTSPRVCNNTVPGFTCLCDVGFLESAAGECTESIFYAEMLLDLNIPGLSASTYIAGSAEYEALTAQIAAAVEEIGRAAIGSALIGIRVKSFRQNDIAEIEIIINELQTNNTFAEAALVIEAVSDTPTLNISSEYQSVPNEGVSVGDYQVGSSALLCTIFEQLTTCSHGTECRISYGRPSCQQVDDDDNYELIIGLGVGIPVFILLVICIAVAVYLYLGRKRRTEGGSTPSVDRDTPFRSIFATQMATKGSLGSPHRFSMYSPDAYSEATSESSGDGQLLRTKQKVRSDFQDSPWYDNRGATPRDLNGNGSQGAPTEATGGPTSNFSWEYMFRLLEPHRGFEIQRPNLSPVPNPTFTPRDQNPESPA